MIVNSKVSKDKKILLPYIIERDSPEKWGIFGDSFAALAEAERMVWEANHLFKPEHSWISFLADFFNVTCETYGVQSSSNPDIFDTVFNCGKEYSRYIIFMTDPRRIELTSQEKFKKSLCKKLKDHLTGKKVIICYWDNAHKIYDFGFPTILCTQWKTNQNPFETHNYAVRKNPRDNSFGYNHMSLRGNFLFAFDLYRLINSC